jgi:hypothetical protein
MAKLQYQEYSTEKPTIVVREKFGSANVYARDAKSLFYA